MSGTQEGTLARDCEIETKWYAFASKLRSLAYESLQGVEIKLTEKQFAEPKVLALALLARTINNFEGVIALAKLELVVEARVLTRCCYENMFYIGGLIEKGEDFIRQMFDDEIQSRISRGKEVLEMKRASNTMPEEIGKALPERIEEMKKRWPKAKFLNPSDAAKSSVLKNAYLAYRQLSADAAHPSLRALQRHMAYDKVNDKQAPVLNIKPIKRHIELTHTINLACCSLMGACVGLNQLLERTCLDQKIHVLTEEWVALNRDLDAAISDLNASKDTVTPASGC